MECRRQQLKLKTLLLQHCALHKYQVIDGQNMCDQITSDRRSNQQHTGNNSLLKTSQFHPVYQPAVRVGFELVPPDCVSEPMVKEGGE